MRRLLPSKVNDLTLVGRWRGLCPRRICRFGWAWPGLAVLALATAAASSPAAWAQDFAAEPVTVTPSVAAITPTATNDDDWDRPGEVDRRPRLSGIVEASWRSTVFAGGHLPDGKPVEDDHTFQMDHAHVKLNGDLSAQLSWEIIACLTHMNEFSVATAHGTYAWSTALQLSFGRFLLPFGQFNVRSLPGNFTTISRPLLYASHDDRPLALGVGTPQRFLFTPRDDTGLLAGGNLWFGPDDVVQVSWNAYFTNGIRPNSDTMSRFWDDNNNGKQAGGRVGVGWNGTSLSANLAGSYLWDRYDANLDLVAWAVDGVVAWNRSPTRRVTLRGEVVSSSRAIAATTELLAGDAGVSGAYATLEADLADGFAAFYQFDYLSRRTPRAKIDETFADMVVRQQRHLAGLAWTVAQHLVVKGEYAWIFNALGTPDAHRVAIQAAANF